MVAPAPRGRLNIAMIMVIIAFLAISLAGATATYRDRNRPDFMLAMFCFYAAMMAATGFFTATGRALAATWGQSLGALSVFFAGEIWMGTVFAPLPVDNSFLPLLLWNYWPTFGAMVAAVLGGYLARRRYDRLHTGLDDSPVAANPASSLQSLSVRNKLTIGVVSVLTAFAVVAVLMITR